jgi:hypothetical protein
MMIKASSFYRGWETIIDAHQTPLSYHKSPYRSHASPYEFYLQNARNPRSGIEEGLVGYPTCKVWKANAEATAIKEFGMRVDSTQRLRVCQIPERNSTVNDIPEGKNDL